jgi:two-component system CheB/CheR fusion protein
MRVSFDRLLHEELSAHVPLGDGAGADHVILEGPLGVALKSGAVQTFALALHELATNAVKYGALSQEEGRLHVTWDVKDLPGRPRQLCVDWRETGVSDLQPPAQAKVIGGYGRELIEKALPHQLGARTTYAFEPGGVHCTIEVDVPYEGTPMEGTHV